MRIGVTGHRRLHDSTAEVKTWAKIAALLSEHASADDEALSSLAISADQIFARAAVAAGLRLHAVLPCRGYAATFSLGELPGYEALLTTAVLVTTLDFAAPSETAFEAAGRFIVDHCDALIAIWNGRPPRGRGGTGGIVEYASNMCVPLFVIPVP